MGKIIDGDDKYAIIRFNKAKEIMFTHYDSHLIDLGYAINVYKSQGSEFPLIVLFIFMDCAFCWERVCSYFQLGS